MSKRTILTGATGFVGANLARRLLQDGHDVHLLVRPGFSAWRIEAIRADVKLHLVELSDAAATAEVVAAIKPEWIFHLAVHGAYSWQTGLREMIDTNISGTANLLEAALRSGFEAFVNTGSSSEYGFKNSPPSEREWLEPNSYYAVTKASATLLCRYTAQSRGMHIPTLRLYSVYGAYEDPLRLMPALVINGLAGRLPPLVNPDTARDYVYIDDVSEAYLLAAASAGQEPGAVYNVGSGVQTSLREAVEAAMRVLGIETEPEWGSMPNRSWDTSVWVADNRLIQQALGWQPRHSFEDGFRLMAEWFRQNPQMQEFYRQQQRKI